MPIQKRSTTIHAETAAAVFPTFSRRNVFPTFSRRNVFLMDPDQPKEDRNAESYREQGNIGIAYRK